MLIRTVGFKLIQYTSGLQIAETGGRIVTDSSQVLSRQIVHNAVGSLPLAKNALHSPTSYFLSSSSVNPLTLSVTKSAWIGSRFTLAGIIICVHA